MKYLFAVYVVLLSGCGGDPACKDKRIIQIKNCAPNYQLQCQSCTVSFDDGTNQIMCEPIQSAVYRTCTGAL